MVVHFLTNWFAKITGWPVQKIVFNTKVSYEDPSVQKRKIKGPAIIISNHTSVFDYAAIIFVFFGRTLRYQMAELLFKKFPLGILLRLLGGIYVDRNTHNFDFIHKSMKILKKNGVVGIYPESRIPLKHEETPLPFKTSAAYLALLSGVQVIPVYTTGEYFNKKVNKVIIGKPFYAADLADDSLSEKENLELVSKKMREIIISLSEKLQ